MGQLSNYYHLSWEYHTITLGKTPLWEKRVVGSTQPVGSGTLVKTSCPVGSGRKTTSGLDIYLHSDQQSGTC
jgi:hypothetical protein